MPHISPFKAYRYNPAKISSYDDVLTPPYDVISKSDQDEFYKKSPYNFVRIDLRKGNGDSDIYEEAKNELENWIKQQVLLQEKEPAFYVYHQEYTNALKKKTTRLGFFCLMKIEDAKVKKHENTLTGPKKDRALLMERTLAQLSPIFGLFQEKAGKIHAHLKKECRKDNFLFQIEQKGVKHSLYKAQNPKVIEAIQKTLKNKYMYIADGHHRYEVTKNMHGQLQIPAANGSLGSGYIFTYLCDAERNDMTILPTHRVLSQLKSNWQEAFWAIAKKQFVIKKSADWTSLEKMLQKKNTPKQISWGVFFGGQYHLLTFKKTSKDLDVTLLQKFFVQPLLEEDVAVSKKISFTRDAKEAIAQVESKSADLAFLLKPMPIQDMIRVSNQGVKLPQKSTYFYPKIQSGMLFYKL